MLKINWIHQRGVWSGECPRCGTASFFSPTWSHQFSDGTTIDVVECPAIHPFVICSKTNTNKQEVLFVSPISSDSAIPSWLPEQYHSAYKEMLFDFGSKKYRSAISVAGIILDAHINSLLKYKGDQRKQLKRRLEILADAKLIDHDQFSDATVARLGRNEIIHPDDIAKEIGETDAKDVIDAVMGCIERFYRWRRAKALPAPAEKTADPSTPVELEENSGTSDDQSKDSN